MDGGMFLTHEGSLMNLYELAEPHPNFHRHGPQTERDAAASHAKARVANAELVLAMVRRHPGKTACELWELATADEMATLKDYYEVRRRLSDMTHSGDVVVGESRKCSIKGTKQQTYTARSS